MKATDEQIKGWKAQYGRIYEVELATSAEAEPTYAYFKHPPRSTVSNVYRKLSAQDVVGSQEVLVNDCFLGGDPLVKEDTALLMGAASQLQQFIQPAAASLKNL